MTDINIEHIMKLARLGLSDAEKSDHAKQLKDILKYVEQLNEVDTFDVEAMAHATGVKNIYRTDEVKLLSSEDIAKLVKAAPAHVQGFIKVKKVL